MAKSDTVQRAAHGLSDGGHGLSGQAGLLPDFLSHSGASIGPLDGLRRPADGPTAAVPHGDSILTGSPASILEHPGRPGNLLDGLRGPRAVRAARVFEAVSAFLRSKKSSTRQAKRPKWIKGRKRADLQPIANRAALTSADCAERRMGEMLAVKPPAIRGKPGPGRGKKGSTSALPPFSDDMPSLVDLGISKRESADAQKLAAIPTKRRRTPRPADAGRTLEATSTYKVTAATGLLERYSHAQAATASDRPGDGHGSSGQWQGQASAGRPSRGGVEPPTPPGLQSLDSREKSNPVSDLHGATCISRRV